MKKVLTILLASLLTLTLFAGCGKNNENPDNGGGGNTEKKLKVACLLNGNLGDKSFFDSANNGMKLVKEQLGADTKVIEMGFDNTKWETVLLDTSEQDYDIIVVGTYQMQEILEKVAPQYPEKKYIIFDSSVNYEKGKFENVYAITFKQNEASFLAGALASMIASDATLNPSGKNIIGAVGAMEIPVINDFIVGYIDGAVHNNKDTKVSVSYIGDFNDTAKAKELAIAQYKLGAAISMNVAAQAGLGLMEAAALENKYAIGVDADQALSLLGSKPEQANKIVSSVMKNIDNVVLLSIKKHIEGTLPYGKTESLGIQEGAVGLADNEIYQKIATEEMRTAIKALEGQVKSGEIKVKSAFDMTAEDIKALRDSVNP
ncbi:MAG: BMP family ABC transporter substrate-binding protein [Clostridiales bacterium]|nr:MAG: BMP family ABC transporter substrate-binding protein [Clostridiales bacterium]